MNREKPLKPKAKLMIKTGDAKVDRKRQNMLQLVWNSWIEGEFKNSLYNYVFIEPGMRSKSDAVENPWNILHLEGRALTPYPASEAPPILELFDQANGSLLILGEPGAGKTTMLLQLCRQAIERGKDDPQQPIPVVFNLFSWKPDPKKKPEQTFSDWLLRELRNRYSVPNKISRQWIDNDALLLLLDGLDEVPVEDREECIQVINTFREEHKVQFAICSRRHDYRGLLTRLKLRHAVIIQPLTKRQVNSYLKMVGKQFIDLYKALVTYTEQINCNQDEKDFLQTPLFLNLLALAYQNVLVIKLEALAKSDHYRRTLIDAYIAQMVKRRRAGHYYTREKTLAQLAWLARTMLERRQMIFNLEDIQPGWLHLPERRISFFLGLLGVLLGASLGGILGGLLGGLPGGLLGAILGGLRFGLSEGSRRIATEEPGSQEGGIKTHLKNFLLCWLNEGLIGVINQGLVGKSIKERIIPGDGIKTFLNISLIRGLSVFLIFELIGRLMGGLSIMVVFGLVCGLTSVLDYGGYFIFKHFISRWFLYRSNSLPWNVADFLDHCANCLLLRQVGGGYIFVHRMLMEHFAAMWEENYAKEKA